MSLSTFSADALIDSPPHYQSHGIGHERNIEAIDVIEEFGFGESYHAGSALKYLLRAGRKGPASTDFGKALWYLRRGTAAECVAPVPFDDDMTDAIDDVLDAFAFRGAHRLAVETILRWACGTLPDPAPDEDGVLPENIAVVIGAVEAALIEAETQAATARVAAALSDAEDDGA